MKRVLSVCFLLLFDTLAFYLSLLLAFITRKALGKLFIKSVVFSFSFYHFLKFWWIPLVFLFFIWYQKLYTKRLIFWDEAKELIKAIFLSAVFVLAVLTLSKSSNQMSRLMFVILCIYAVFIFPIFRLLGKKLLNRLGIYKEDIIIIGAGQSGVGVAKGILENEHLGYRIKGFLDDFKKGVVKVKDEELPILGSTEDIFHVENIKYAIISMPSAPKERIADISNKIHRYAKHIYIVPDLKGIGLLNSELYYLFTEQLFLIKITNNLESFLNQVIKRVFDIVLSVVLLPFLLVFIGILAFLIKIDSKGPVFFIQDRLGKDGKLFKCIKFRTMYVDNEKILKDYLEKNQEVLVEWQTYKKLKKDDPRITKIGKFLRKTSLDELPQIFNVILGDMSLIGPRPYLPSEEADIGAYKEYILLTRPGITGLWQVSGRNELSFEDRVKLDTWYVINWSLWLDIVILFKTIRVVLKKEGAY